MEAPVVDSLRNRFEVLNNLVNWIADVWRSKNLVRRLLLCDVIIFTLFNPYVPLILKIAPTTLIPKNYELYFWVTVSFFFVIATIIAIRTKSNKTISADITLRSPIKGLLPFDTADEVIFTQLQRNHELIECSQVITDNNFRIGILSAESGNGKTSFLRAGLLPALQKLNHRCIYIKVTDIDPIISIKQTLTDSIVDEIPEDSNLIETFKNLVKIEGRDAPPLVILLDQFEQFFVHQKRKKDRELFIKQLCDWYKNNNALRVKILISIRSDFRGRLDEIHKAMGYSPGPQQIFLLEKFTPEQASSIFNTLAESVQLECDKSFLEEMTARELASSDDGLISPVDIQILSWMIAHQSTDSDRSFTRKAFQRLGGVEGLLERFLSRALDARESQLKRKNAVHVLLGLTDLDRNTRTGPLTSHELMLKLGNLISESDLRESLEWLVRGDVRLVQSSKNNQTELFELSHERLIPALRRVASKDLSEADKANFLLDRRSGEWQGNKHHRRYLLSLRELLLIRKQKPFLQWGQNKEIKKELISASYKRQYFLASLLVLPILLLLSLYPLSRTQFVQLQLIKREISESLKNTSEISVLKAAIRAFVINGQIDKAEKLLETMNSDDKKYGQISIVRALIDSGIKQKDRNKVEQAIKYITKLSKFSYHHELALIAATAMNSISETQRAIDIFNETSKILESKNYYSDPTRWKMILIESAIAINTPSTIKKANEYFETISIYSNITGSFHYYDPDQDTIMIYVSDEPFVSDPTDISFSVILNFGVITKLKAGKNESEIRDFINDFFEKRSNSENKVELYVYCTQLLYSYGLMQLALEMQKSTMDWIVFQSEYNHQFSWRFLSITSHLEPTKNTLPFLIELENFVLKSKNEPDKILLLSQLSEKMAIIAGETLDKPLLDKVIQRLNKKEITDHVSLLYSISEALTIIAIKQQNLTLLDQAQRYIGLMSEEASGIVYKPLAINSIAKAAATIGDYRLARTIARSHHKKADELKTLCAILEVSGQSH